MSDRHVNTFHVLTFLVDDRVDGDSGFSCLSITNDKLTLSTTNWDHGVHRLNTCLQRNAHALACHDTWSDLLDRIERLRDEFAFAVDWISQGIDDAS